MSWLSEDTNLDDIPIDDESDREEIKTYKEYPKHFDVREIPLDKIGKDFCTAFGGHFHRIRSNGYSYSSGTLDGPFSDLTNVDKTLVFINEPEVRSDMAFHDELPIKIHSYHITFRVSFGYYVRDFHKDANLLIERIVEIIKSLHDWSNFGAVASCAFEASRVLKVIG
ncbi:MAG TPA: hypothetical protein VMS31_02090 [Pyrinomonadaceae bacterium]|nr:hypothetical protein [Pyrinomonadaceae bacterium]